MIEVGNDAITIGMRSHKHGIKLHIQTLPEVEAFFEQWSGGVQERPAHGRLWKPARTGDTLTVWAFGMPLTPSSMRPYSLLHTGAGFLTENSHPNISFLRLVGISNSDGVEFVMEALIGRGEIAQLGARLSDACNMFYSEYLQPVNIRAVVSVFQLPAAA